MDSFANRVYKVAKKIPTGKVSTYQEIAKALKSKAYQAVGQALRKNPYAPVVPCHRVVASNGTIGGFMGKKSGQEIRGKRKLLSKEGIKFSGDKIENFSDVFLKLS